MKYIIGARPEIKVVLDWTDFAKKGQKTLQLSLVTSHGRATPLIWNTVLSNELKHEQRNHERALLEKFKKYRQKVLKSLSWQTAVLRMWIYFYGCKRH